MSTEMCHQQNTSQSSNLLATPSTFSFTPLTKPVDEANKKEERTKDEEKTGKILRFLPYPMISSSCFSRCWRGEGCEDASVWRKPL